MAGRGMLWQAFGIKIFNEKRSMACHGMPRHAMACHSMPWHAECTRSVTKASQLNMQERSMACQGMPRHAMACHGMPWHAVACSGMTRHALVNRVRRSAWFHGCQRASDGASHDTFCIQDGVAAPRCVCAGKLQAHMLPHAVCLEWPPCT